MKTVILLLGMFFCLAASAQQEQRQDVEKKETRPDKKTSAKKARKSMPVMAKITEKVEIINGEEIISLMHTQEYNSKSAFQIMLEKRLEIDAAAARKQRKTGENK